MARSFLSAIALTVIMAAWLCSAQTAAVACIHQYDKEPSRADVAAKNAQEYFDLLTANENWPPHPDELEKLRLAADAGDYRAKTNYAVGLILLHDLPQAIEILNDVEQQKPGESIVALNLGTAYELAGDNENALKWIAAGVRRAPQSHDDGEWVHVRILEAKLAHADDLVWFKSHSVIGLDVGNATTPAKPSRVVVDPSGHSKALAAVRAALEYQLHERLSLVKPPDPVVSNLLADLGHLQMLEEKPAYAIPVYGLAMRYDPDRDELLQQRLYAAERAVRVTPYKDEYVAPLLTLLVAGLMVGIVVAVAIYLKQFLHKSTQPAAGTA